MAKKNVPGISAVIIAFNEKDCIARAVKSVKWADEIIVVDSGSTDGTAAIARSHGAKVTHNEWPGFARQKNFAIKKASMEWVLSLDADEEVSPELASEISASLKSTGEFSGFWIKRKNFYYGSGSYMKYGSVFPDASVRLIKKGAAFIIIRLSMSVSI